MHIPTSISFFRYQSTLQQGQTTASSAENFAFEKTYKKKKKCFWRNRAGQVTARPSSIKKYVFFHHKSHMVLNIIMQGLYYAKRYTTADESDGSGEK